MKMYARVENLLKSEAAFLTSLYIAIEVTHSEMICCTEVGCFIGLLGSVYSLDWTTGLTQNDVKFM